MQQLDAQIQTQKVHAEIDQKQKIRIYVQILHLRHHYTPTPMAETVISGKTQEKIINFQKMRDRRARI
jgi:hypothetical protein